MGVMTQIRGLLSYVPTTGASRVPPVDTVTNDNEQHARKAPNHLSLVRTGGRPAPVPALSGELLVSLSALPRRRGLKADPSERNRYARAYAGQAADTATPPPMRERRA